MPNHEEVPGEEESIDLFDFDRLYEESSSSSSGAADFEDEPPLSADAIDFDELVAALPDFTEDGDLVSDDADEDDDEPLENLFMDPAPPTPAPAPEPEVVTQGRRLSPLVIGLLVGVTVLNLALVGLTLRTSKKLEATVADVGRQVISTAEDIRDETNERSRELEQLVQPVVVPSSAEGQALQLAQEALAEGEFALARMRLNGLLAVLDSFDEKHRADIEARASFMLADTLLLESQARRSRAQ